MQIEKKIATKFGIGLKAAGDLVDAGLDTPVKIKGASDSEIEEAAGSEALSIIRQRYAEPE